MNRGNRMPERARHPVARSRPLVVLSWCWLGNLAWMVLLGAFAGISPAAAQEVEVEAAEVTYDRERNHYRYTDATLRVAGLQMSARRIDIDLNTRRLTATGQVRFREKDISGVAQRLEWTLDTQRAELYQAHLYDEKTGYRLKAQQVSRPAPGHYLAMECSLTSCTPRQGGWLLRARELEFHPEGYVVGRHAWFSIGGLPLFYFPWLALPTLQERYSGFLAPTLILDSPSITRLNLGWRWQLPYFWALGVDHDLTITPEWISRRGLGSDWDYRYAFQQGQNGQLRLFAIRERFFRNPAAELLPQEGAVPEGPFRPTRHALRWDHNQGIGERQRLLFSLRHARDGQVWREYLGLEHVRPQLTYQAAYSAMSAGADFSLLSAHNSFFREESIFSESGTDGRFQPRLSPRLGVYSGGRALGALRWTLTGQSIRFGTDQALSGQLEELRPELVLPLRLGGSWELRSALARRLVGYRSLSERLTSVSPQPLASRSRARNEIDMELRASWGRVFSFQNEDVRLKHLMTPRLRFVEVEDLPQPLAGSFVQSALTSPPPTEELKAGVEPLRYSQRLLSLHLENHWLLGREGNAQSLAHLHLNQPYNLLLRDADVLPKGPVPDPLETAPGTPLLPLILTGELNRGGVNAALEWRYHHQQKRLSAQQFSLGKARGQTRLYMNYFRNAFRFYTPQGRLYPEGNALTLGGKVEAGSWVSLGYAGRIDLWDDTPPLNRRLESAELYLDYHPGCCTLRLTYKENLESTGSAQGDTAFYINRRLLFSFTLNNNPPR